MSSIDVVVDVNIEDTSRVKQVSGMFDVPVSTKLSKSWSVNFLLEEKPWSVGLIVGASGSGKTTIAKKIFGEDKINSTFLWEKKSMIDDFPSSLSVQQIVDACSSVGFNTIPSWLKPYRVLSTGEQFRASVARYLVCEESPIVIDEFTSVVDRQVAKITSHALQKHIRKEKKQFVGVSCHYDIIDWLQPDWVFDMNTLMFEWRSLRRRPEVSAKIKCVSYKAWDIFSPFHYMSASLNKAARCYCLFIEDKPVAFAGILNRPISHKSQFTKQIRGVSRLVVLPDWQGLGIAFAFIDRLGAMYSANNKRFRNYPAHPSFIQSHHHSNNWRCVSKPQFTAKSQSKSLHAKTETFGGRFNATFEYCGSKMNKKQATLLFQ